MSDCLFCRIINGDIKADIVGENAGAIAFRDIHPAAPVHFLVVPREHVASIEELGGKKQATGADVLALINDVTVNEGIDQTGYRIIVNIGDDAEQEVDHVHFHVLGGRLLTWPPG